MKKMIVVIAVLGSASAALFAQQAAPAQPGGTGFRFVYLLKTQRNNTASPADPIATSAAENFRKAVLPEGSVEMEFVTDGQSVRTELHGPMSGLPKGSVVVFPTGQPAGYVLNPAEKTYFVLRPPQLPPMPPGTSLPKPAVSVKPSGTFETIAGLQAEKINMSWSMPMPLPPGAEVQPGMPKDISMEYENWCVRDITMPAAVMRLMNGAEQSMQGLGLEAFTKACPFAVRSRMRMSTMPGVDLLSEVTSLRRDTPSPDLFKLPAGYTEVPSPTPKGQ
jgi:hypothetical protein